MSPAARPATAPVQVRLAEVAVIQRVGGQVVPGVVVVAPLAAPLTDALQLQALLILTQEELVPLYIGTVQVMYTS